MGRNWDIVLMGIALVVILGLIFCPLIECI